MAPIELVPRLRRIVGRRHVLTSATATRRYRQGYRVGGGDALAIVRPGCLVEQWDALQACVDANVVVIFQAANTGLTGGSTPTGGYDRPVVVVNTARITGIHPVAGGEQVICLSGTTLHDLERRLKPLGREPHSVIGSSCIGASVVGGVCNNSGGALVRRGPAFTELALFATVTADGRLALVNHLGVALGDNPRQALAQLDRSTLPSELVKAAPERQASDGEYARHVRAIDAGTPARFNADPRRLFEASGSAGRVAVFAVRLNTFPREDRRAIFYIGTNDASELTGLRRHILAEYQHLPVVGEYIHRDAFALARLYGKDTYLAVKWLGTRRLPRLFAFKALADRLASRLGAGGAWSNRALQRLAGVAPEHLPRRLLDWHRRFEHHLILEVAGDGVAEAREHLAAVLPSRHGAMFECDAQEGEAALLHRFAVAGAAVRYRSVHRDEVADIVALDVALPRNTTEWFERLPVDLDRALIGKFYYGHFLCQVFHQDYLVRAGQDPLSIEEQMHHLLDARGAEYPAEHNVGHHYRAKPALAGFYRKLDPSNSLNPGLGGTSKRAGWGESMCESKADWEEGTGGL